MPARESKETGNSADKKTGLEGYWRKIFKPDFQPELYLQEIISKGYFRPRPGEILPSRPGEILRYLLKKSIEAPFSNEPDTPEKREKIRLRWEKALKMAAQVGCVEAATEALRVLKILQDDEIVAGSVERASAELEPFENAMNEREALFLSNPINPILFIRDVLLHPRRRAWIEDRRSQIEEEARREIAIRLNAHLTDMRQNALKIAVSNGHLEVFKALYDECDEAMRDRRLAGYDGSVEAMRNRWLMFVDTLGQLRADTLGQPEIAEWLLEQGAHESNLRSTQMRQDVLLIAVSKGHLGIVKALCDWRTKEMWDTSLIYAAMSGHSAIVTWLLEQGADETKLRSEDGMGFQDYAAEGGLLADEISNLVFVHRATLRLEKAFKEDAPEDELLSLLAEGANPNGYVRYGQYSQFSFFVMAARRGHLYLVQALVDAGFDPQQKNPDSKTTFMANALRWAADEGHVAVARWLLAHGGRWEDLRNNLSKFGCFVDDHDGIQSAEDADRLIVLYAATLPLLAAFKRGASEDELLALLAAGADPKARFHDWEKTPLIARAAEMGYARLVQAFVNAGADIEAMDRRDAMTPLMVAASEGQVEVVKVLLAAGASWRAKNQKGQTAFSLATQNGHAEVVQLLEAAAESKRDDGAPESGRAVISVALHLLDELAAESKQGSGAPEVGRETTAPYQCLAYGVRTTANFYSNRSAAPEREAPSAVVPPTTAVPGIASMQDSVGAVFLAPPSPRRTVEAAQVVQAQVNEERAAQARGSEPPV